MMRGVLEVEEVLLMQNLTILTVFYVVYGCSIVDENCEISESEMSQFWPYSAYPRLLRMHRRIIVDKISE
jgi:hypothetical protein